jgi:hypothetical protein
MPGERAPWLARFLLGLVLASFHLLPLERREQAELCAWTVSTLRKQSDPLLTVAAALTLTKAVGELDGQLHERRQTGSRVPAFDAFAFEHVYP